MTLEIMFKLENFGKKMIVQSLFYFIFNILTLKKTAYYSCTCEPDFRWSCQKFICKSDCDNPRKVEGQCCPQCSGMFLKNFFLS